MVAAKAAAAAPERVASLTLLGYTLNGWQMAASLVTRPAWLAKVRIAWSMRRGDLESPSLRPIRLLLRFWT